MAIYTPSGCSTLNELTDGQIRLGIQGEPFSGKTYSSLTFPNPVLASFDRKASAHTHRTDVILVPFFDSAFCDKLVKRSGLINPANRRDAFLKWLTTEGVKLGPEQTLIVDNNTGVESAFHQQYWLEPVYNKEMQIDSFAEWNLKKEYYEDVAIALKGIPASVVFICHETVDRDKKGELNGKIRPLLSGQAGDRLAGHYTDWFASTTIGKPIDEKQSEAVMKWAGIDKNTLQEWIASTPLDHKTIYLWQTCSDELRKCGTTTLDKCPKYILADYKSFSKYRRHKA